MAELLGEVDDPSGTGVAIGAEVLVGKPAGEPLGVLPGAT